MLIFLLRFYGVIPLKSRRYNIQNSVKWNVYRLYGLIVAIFYFISTIFSLNEDYYYFSIGEGVRMRTWPQVFVVLADQLSSSLTVAIGLTMINLKYDVLINAAKTYRQIEGIIRTRSRNIFRLPLAIYLLFLSVFLPANLSEFNDNSIADLLTYLPTYLVYLPLVSLQLLYANSFLEMEFTLRCLNDCLPTIVSRPQTYKKFWNNGDGKNLAGRLIWKILQVKINLEKLLGLPLLLLTAHNLLHNIVTPYYVLVNLLRPDISRYNLITWINQAIWLILHFIDLVLIVWPAERFCRQGKRTVQIISTLMNVNKCELTKRKLKLLLLQLKATKFFRVSICGIFWLDSQLIKPIFLNITTYLVILVQLKN